MSLSLSRRSRIAYRKRQGNITEQQTVVDAENEDALKTAEDAGREVTLTLLRSCPLRDSSSLGRLPPFHSLLALSARQKYRLLLPASPIYLSHYYYAP